MKQNLPKVLTSRIDQRVTFGQPGDVKAGGGGQPAYGKVIDEVWANPAINTSPPRQARDANDWGDYSNFAQLIKWDRPFEAHDPHSGCSIRLGYYRRRCGTGGWQFAGQTTLTDYPPAMRSLLEATLAKTSWFQEHPEPAK